MASKAVKPRAQRYTLLTDVQRNIIKRYVMLAGRDDHLTRLTGLTHLESEIRVVEQYFTVVLFVVQFYPICNVRKFINFGLGTVRK